MNATRLRPTVAQLSMPGMPVHASVHANVSCCSATPGQEVLYLGNISGGPRYGSRGTVRRTLIRKAVVDMGRFGTWQIPYYFLAVPEAA